MALKRIDRELLHELAEAACHWDGAPPWICQVTRHEAGAKAGDSLPLMRHPSLEEIENQPRAFLSKTMTEAQRELPDVYRTQLELWQAQVELSDKQTELFRDLAERLVPRDEDKQ